MKSYAIGFTHFNRATATALSPPVDCVRRESTVTFIHRDSRPQAELLRVVTDLEQAWRSVPSLFLCPIVT